MFTPKQLQDFIDAPRALAAFLEGRGQFTYADQPVAALEQESPHPAKPKRERKPRDKTLVKRTEKATNRPAIGITYDADGARTVKVGGPDADEGAPLNGNPWDEVLHGDG